MKLDFIDVYLKLCLNPLICNFEENNIFTRYLMEDFSQKIQRKKLVLLSWRRGGWRIGENMA